MESNRGGPGFTREGELIGAAKEAHEAKMAKERGEKPADSSEGLHGAAKQQHEAKMAREVCEEFLSCFYFSFSGTAALNVRGMPWTTR